ncbi:MAG: tetratricopeptide repeat protein, partial [Janthinobacterium lividum]
MANFLKQRAASLFSPRGKLRYALSLIEAGEVGRAFAPLSAAATAGIPEAQFRVGRAYLDGAGVPVSREEGARWIERAAEAGWVEAQVVLATLHLFGLVSGGSGSAVFSPSLSQQDAKPDYERAGHWASRAAEAGSPDGQALLGYILTSGPVELRDLDTADGWYARSAEAGCPQG